MYGVSIARKAIDLNDPANFTYVIRAANNINY